MFKIILLMLISINIHTLASNTWFEKKSKNVFVLMFGPQIMNVDKNILFRPGIRHFSIKISINLPTIDHLHVNNKDLAWNLWITNTNMTNNDLKDDFMNSCSYIKVQTIYFRFIGFILTVLRWEIKEEERVAIKMEHPMSCDNHLGI